MRLSPLILLVLAGCAIHPTVEKTVEKAPVQTCPEVPPVVVAAPQPVWPDTCVANWYAKATLPPCVEAYLKELRTQQKTIAKKHRASTR